MATVTLLQPTDMNGVHTATTSVVTDPNGTEMAIEGSNGYAYLFGTFSEDGGGLVSRAVFDTGDNGVFPNIDISDLSFLFGVNYFSNVFVFGKMFQFLGDLLQTDDKLTGSSGNDTMMGFAGNDTMAGGGGDNLFNGGTGVDTVSYA